MDDFKVLKHWMVFDAIEAGIPIPVEELPKVELGKLLPHTGGSTQILLHGVYPRSVNDPSLTGSAVSEAAKSQTGIYYAEIHYHEPQAAMWQFSS